MRLSRLALVRLKLERRYLRLSRLLLGESAGTEVADSIDASEIR